jgi:hypothetical protein
MGTPAPDAVKRLVDARDMTEMSDISDRVPSPADRKVFLSGDYKEEQLRAEFLNPFFTALGWALGRPHLDTIRARNCGSVPLSLPERRGQPIAVLLGCESGGGGRRVDHRAHPGENQSMFWSWLLVVLAYLLSAGPLALRTGALAMRGHSSRLAVVIIKVLGVLVLLWSLWELFVTTATIVRGLSHS